MFLSSSKTLLFVVTLTLLVFPYAFAQTQDAEYKLVESLCLKARSNIKNGRLQFNVVTSMDNRTVDPVNGKLERYESQYEFNFTPDRLRLDQTVSDLTFGTTPLRNIECNNYDGKGKDFYFSGDTKSVAYQGSQMHNSNELHRLFDPRLLGYVCNDANALRHKQYRLEDSFGYANLRDNVTLESRVLDGETIYDISWIQLRSKSEQERGLTDRRKRRTTISPTRGYNIIKTTVSGLDSKNNVVWSKELNNTLKKYVDIWYVSDYTFTSSGNGSPSISETMHVKDAWFNRADPLESFELKSFGLQPGQNIYDKDTKKTIIFDGDNARLNVAEELAKAASNATPLAPVPGTINYWLVFVCVGAAGVGAFLIFRLLRKGRANAS